MHVAAASLWVPRALSADTRRIAWLLLALVLPVTVLISHAADAYIGQVKVIVGSAATMFAWFALAWTAPRPRGWIVAATALTGLAMPVLICVPLGIPLLDSVRIAAALVLQGAIMFAGYLVLGGNARMLPDLIDDLVVMFAASTISTLAVIPLGPTIGLDLSTPTLEVLWWVVLNVNFSFVIGTCLMLLVFRHPDGDGPFPALAHTALLSAFSAATLILVFGFPEVELLWTLALPAIWAGLIFRLWAAAYFSLVYAMVGMLLALFLDTPNDWPIPHTVLLALVFMVAVFVVLLLSMLREQREQLDSEVEFGRRAAADQAGLFARVFESMNDGLAIFDSSGRLELENAALTRIAGPTAMNDIDGQWMQQLRGVYGSGAFELVVAETGRNKVIALHHNAVWFDGGSKIIAIARDVTSEQHRIEELANFAAIAAHDLKGPLTAVQGWLELAEESLPDDPGTAHAAFQRVRSASRRMTRELDDWLTFNVAREGGLEPQRASLQELITSAIPMGADADISVHSPHVVYADPILLRHLLANLLSNALKYTRLDERAVIEVTSTWNSSSGWVSVRVSDQGIGVPVGEEERIFEPNRRAPEVVDAYEGSGIGLALCKRIVARHGGEIWVERNQHRGTTVTFTLPGEPPHSYREEN